MSDPAPLRPILVRLLEGRVGSTLVMQLLSSAPEIALDRVYPFENSYLTYFVRLLGQISADPAPGQDMVDFLYGERVRVGPLPFSPAGLDLDEVAREGLRGVWGAFSRAMGGAATGTAAFYAEKYWGDVGPVIASGLEPVIVDLVRDPRDIVASVRAYNAKRGRELFGRGRAHSDRAHLRRLVIEMSLRLAEFQKPLAVPHLVIRYEDLVSDLPGQVSRLESLLGVRLDPAVLSTTSPHALQHMTSASAETSVGRWARDLAGDEVQTVERGLATQMVSLGYAPAGKPTHAA